MNINEVPFLRDNRWTITPILYFLLLISVSILFLSINISHEYVDSKQNEIDGIVLNAQFTNDADIFNIHSPQSHEYIIIAKILSSNNFRLNSKKSSLQNLSSVLSLSVLDQHNKVIGIGYIASNSDDCRKLRAISISKLGEHHMFREDDSLNEKISWKSKKNKFTFFNQFSSHGIQLDNICTYLISNR